MNKRAAIPLDKYLIGFVIFSLIIVGTLFVMNDAIDNYDLDISTNEFNETYNKIDETYELSQDVSDDMLEAEVKGEDESWTSLVKNSYKAVRRTVTGSFGLIITIAQELAKTVGIPSFVIVLAMTAISIAVLFALIYLIFRIWPK